MVLEIRGRGRQPSPPQKKIIIILRPHFKKENPKAFWEERGSGRQEKQVTGKCRKRRWCEEWW
jgi:hypothetical protein